MANVRVITSIRNARLDAIKTAIDAGGSAGTLVIYPAPQATNADTATGLTPIGTLTFTLPSAPAASGGVLTFSAIAQANATQSGTATWARIKASNGSTVFDCDVGTSGTTIVLNTASITIGGPIQISSFTLTDPAT